MLGSYISYDYEKISLKIELKMVHCTSPHGGNIEILSLELHKSRVGHHSEPASMSSNSRVHIFILIILIGAHANSC